ncbi:MAG: MFS transporter [Dehalococcoidia bacterium]|nr:MFS transporter [Dehalococcoidia bacterium]HRC63302.1 MFS transporter [Dehalococcoidia bacterium]
MLRKLFPNVYEGWLVTGSFAFIVVLIGSTFFYGFGTIFNPVITEFGWSKASVSFGFSLRSEVQGLGAPAIGFLVDRFSARRVLIGGIVVTALGVIGMSFMQNLLHFYLAMFIIAFGVSACGGPVGMVATASWFERRRARALSLMTVGGGISGLFVVFIAWLVEAVGWRDGLRVMGLLIVIVGSFVALNVRSRPANHPQPIDGIAEEVDADGRTVARVDNSWGVPAMQACRTKAFLMIALGQAALSFSTTALMVHTIPFMEDNGVSKSAAASAITIFAVTTLVGRLGFGWLADRYDKRVLLAIGVGIVAVGMPLLAVVHSYWTGIAVLAFIAPGFGGVIPVRPALLVDYFGTRHFGTINGMNMLVVTLGSFFGPWAVGLLVDRNGDYASGWLLCGAVAALAVPLMFAATPPRGLVERYGAEATRRRAASAASTATAAQH